MSADAEVLLELSGVTAGYRPGRPVLRDIDFIVRRGEFVSVIGPNGSGKTTLLRVAAGVLALERGTVVFCGRPIGAWRRRELAQRMAVVPQLSAVAFEFTVAEFVGLGRTPYIAPWSSLGRQDRSAIEKALELTDLTDLAGASITQLSGGEFQRAVLARALAQEPEFLLLDEPTAFLDPGHCARIMALLEELSREGMTIVGIFHDLNIPAAYGSRILALRNGRVFADGPVEQVIDSRVLSELYGTPMTVVQRPDGRKVVVVERGRWRGA